MIDCMQGNTPDLEDALPLLSSLVINQPLDSDLPHAASLEVTVSAQRICS